MASLSKKIINDRADLDSLKGTPEYDHFMQMLSGSIKKVTDVQEYPEGYGEPDYDGETLEPIWQETKDYSTIKRYGFTEKDFW